MRVTAESMYLTLGQAGQYLGVSRWLVWDRVRRGELPTFSDPLDRRRRLVRQADLEQLREIRREAA